MFALVNRPRQSPTQVQLIPLNVVFVVFLSVDIWAHCGGIKREVRQSLLKLFL